MSQTVLFITRIGNSALSTICLAGVMAARGSPKPLVGVRVSGGTPAQWGISSAGRAVALQAKGHRFDPVILHQTICPFS